MGEREARPRLKAVERNLISQQSTLRAGVAKFRSPTRAGRGFLRSHASSTLQLKKKLC